MLRLPDAAHYHVGEFLDPEIREPVGRKQQLMGHARAIGEQVGRSRDQGLLRARIIIRMKLGIADLFTSRQQLHLLWIVPANETLEPEQQLDDGPANKSPDHNDDEVLANKVHDAADCTPLRRAKPACVNPSM